MDWLQRSFGDNQTEDQIMKYMGPVNDLYRIWWHESSRAMVEQAGFVVTQAEDMYAGVLYTGCAPPEHRDGFAQYSGPEFDLFRNGKLALDAARAAGVFTVGMIVAEKPHQSDAYS